jgi:hypothetical protein
VPHSETFIDGVWYPSVSTVIGAQPKPWIQAWRVKWGDLAERKMYLASEIGTAFHDCVEQYLDTGSFIVHHGESGSGLPPSCVGRVAGMVESFIEWALSIDGTIEHTELKVISKAHRYSGTCDAIGKIGKKRLLIDWKTGSAIYGDMDLQLVAYAQAYNEMTGSKIKDGLIVHISKDKPHFKLKTKEFKLGKRVFAKFLKLRAMFDIVSTHTMVTEVEDIVI